MAELANDCVIVVESDDDGDDDDIIVVDEHGNPSEHDVIFVRRDRRRTGSNQRFPDKILSKLSENASNKPRNDTTEGVGKNLHHLLDKLDSPEQPSDHGDVKQNDTPQLKVLSNGTVTWNSDMKPLQPSSGLPHRSQDVKLIADRKVPSHYISDLLSPASPSTSIDSTDVAASNSPSPFFDNKGSIMWSPASPDASKTSSDIAGRRFPSRFADLLFSPASPDACINNTDTKHCPSHCSDDVDTAVSSPVSSGASTDSADVARRNSPSPLSDNTDSSLSSPASPDASQDSADLFGKHSLFHSALSNPCSPAKSINSNDSDTSARHFSSSPILHSYDSCNASINGTIGSNSPPSFSSDGVSSSPASPCTSVSSADQSATVERANHLTSSADKKSGTNQHRIGECIGALLALTKKVTDTVATSQQTASAQQDCTCSVTQGMCRTCIANLDNAKAKSKTHTCIANLDSTKPKSKTLTVISPPTVSLHTMPSMSFTSGQMQSTINKTNGSKLMFDAATTGNKPPTIVSSIMRNTLPTGVSLSAAAGPNTCVPQPKRSLSDAVNGTSYSTIVAKKQRLLPATCQPQPGTSGVSNTGRSIDHNLCFGCGILITAGNLSQCLDNHRCCSQCLQQQAKSLLTKQSKGSLKCFYPGCESFYPLSQLRKTLPAMVIEIVEEKLEQESLENATKFMMGQMGEVSGEDKKERVDTWTLPRHWEPMDINGDMKTVEVIQGSESYMDVEKMFHRTMHAPRAEIVRIRRVQNPILWQFYSVKRRQMLQEVGTEELREMKLFHGTSSSVVDAICKGNFDWRLCGTHGTVFGQGSYFARDAKYAHMYTDGGNATLRNTPGTVGMPLQNFLRTLGAPQMQLPIFHAFTPVVSPVTGGPAPVWQNTTISGPQTCRSRHTMFIARVLVGNYTIGHPALRKPPPLNPSDIYGKCYDSCVNDVNDPRIYVIFDNAQCYPEYIIEYMNVPRWAIMAQ